jgi:hypothetical protein
MIQTFFTSPVKGTGLRGIELDRCYVGECDSEGRRHGLGVYRFPNHMVFEGNYRHGLKHGAQGPMRAWRVQAALVAHTMVRCAYGALPQPWCIR